MIFFIKVLSSVLQLELQAIRTFRDQYCSRRSNADEYPFHCTLYRSRPLGAFYIKSFELHFVA
jgi:hypothetical protein